MKNTESIFDNITYEDERLYNNIKQVADKKFGSKPSIQKSIYILNEYRGHDAKYKINPKRKIRDKTGILSRVKKLKSRQSKLKVNVSKAARQFILQQKILEVQANSLLDQDTKDWITIDLDYLVNISDKKIIDYIRAGRKETSVEFLDQKEYKKIKDLAETKFGPETAQEIKDMYIYRSYKNSGNPLKYHNVSAPTNDAPQGLAPESSTWKLPRASDKDLQFKSFIQSFEGLDEEEKIDLLDFIDKIHIDYNEEV